MAVTDHVNVQRIGPYTKGEVPRPLDITFKDELDVVLDLTGFTLIGFKIEAVDQVVAGLGAGTSEFISPETAGVTRYTWVAADFVTAGLYRAQMWVEATTPAARYASEVFEWVVEDLTENPL